MKGKSIKVGSIIFVGIVVLSSVVFAFYEGLLTIPTQGTLTYAEIQSVPSSIQWGNMTYGVPNIKTVRIDNVSNVTITGLTMNYTFPVDWNASLTWNLEGQNLTVGQSLWADFNLTVFDTPEDGPFNFSIDIDDS